jgi:UDP-N-acetylmuramoyl-L-alanyl-D-glutamate--2,6-diaminopimelate ligase
MLLRELLAEMNVLAVHGSTAVEIAGISYEARRVLPGDLYFSFPRDGGERDSELELAMSRGAAALVCRPTGNLRQRITRIEVNDTRLALAEASANFYGRAGEKLHVIGVTGGPSPWKTAQLTKQLLEAAGIKAGLISTLQHEVGERTLPSTHAPESSDIQKLFAAMVRAGCTACVLELPSISPAALKEIPINVLVYGGGEQNLRALSLFVQQRAATPMCGIVNWDDENGRSVTHSSIFKMQLTYGFNDSAEVRATETEFSRTGTRFLIEAAGCTAGCELPLVGKENVHHLLAAAAASLCVITPRQLLTAMKAVRTPPCSFEAIPNDHGLSVYVDEAHSAERLMALLNCAQELRPTRILMALGSPQGTTGKERFDLGRIAGQFANHVILTSDNPGTENVNEICSTVAQGLESAAHCSYHVQPDRSQALREVIAMAEPEDIVLIVGKGARTYQIIGNTIVPFSDREVAREHLQTMLSPRERRPDASTPRALVAA